MTSYKTPPIGAPNATATPAEQAELSVSLLLASLWENFGNSLVRIFAAQAAMCTKGPSFPRFMPVATERVSPTALTTRVLIPKKPCIIKPDKIVLTSGMPEPAAQYSFLPSGKVVNVVIVRVLATTAKMVAEAR